MILLILLIQILIWISLIHYKGYGMPVVSVFGFEISSLVLSYIAVAIILMLVIRYIVKSVRDSKAFPALRDRLNSYPVELVADEYLDRTLGRFSAYSDDFLRQDVHARRDELYRLYTTSMLESEVAFRESHKRYGDGRLQIIETRLLKKEIERRRKEENEGGQYL